MNILLLGNGYDLNYKLPTSYRNFLLTIDFLIKHQPENIHTVGDVFGNIELNTQDEFIKASYDSYKEEYDSLPLDKTILTNIVDKAKNNIWFSYFLKSFNHEIKWIDFEREIAFVVNSFQVFFSKADVTFMPGKVLENKGMYYLIKEVFNFFIGDMNYSSGALPTGAMKIKAEYTTEYPIGSGAKIINKEKIISVIWNSLEDFISVLRSYLQCFVENSAEVLIEKSKIIQVNALNYTDVAVTLNYTNTYELFAPEVQIFHIHGNIKNAIVLGINPDENDDGDSINTSFLQFKKYYQRTFWESDTDYLRWLRDLLDQGLGSSDIHLLVMGHSLDITDEEIIRDLFSISSEITILFHNESAKAQYIHNLVKIFGKEKFDQIRDEQKLEFLPLSMDFMEFEKKRAANSTRLYEAKLNEYL